MNVPRLAPLIVAGALCLAGLAHAKPWWMRGAQSNDDEFLPPDQAFQVSARIDGNRVRIRWVIADGYYLYKQRMAVDAESPDLVISAAEFPPGQVKTDPYLGTQEIYTQQVEATAGYTRSDGGAHPLEIKVTYQGCATAGLCYPPIVKVMFPASANPAIASHAGGNPAPAALEAKLAPPGTFPPRAQPIPQAKAPPHPWEVYAMLGGLLAFFLAGLLLQKSRKLPLPK